MTLDGKSLLWRISTCILAVCHCDCTNLEGLHAYNLVPQNGLFAWSEYWQWNRRKFWYVSTFCSVQRVKSLKTRCLFTRIHYIQQKQSWSNLKGRARREDSYSQTLAEFIKGWIKLESNHRVATMLKRQDSFSNWLSRTQTSQFAEESPELGFLISLQI